MNKITDISKKSGNFQSEGRIYPCTINMGLIAGPTQSAGNGDRGVPKEKEKESTIEIRPKNVEGPKKE